MNLASATSFIELIETVRRIPRREPMKPTFMEIAGYPHYENQISNILAFFLDPASPHRLGSLCFDALLECAKINEVLVNATVEREKETASRNFIDIFITSDNYVIAIENKIFASLTNPFEDYFQFASTKADGRSILMVLLTIEPLTSPPPKNFVSISYTQLITALRSRLGRYIRDADARYLVFLADFMNNIENLTRPTQMDTNLLSFFDEYKEDVERLIEQTKQFRAEMRRNIKSLQQFVDMKRRHNIVKSDCWREEPILIDVLFYEIEIGIDRPAVVDTELSPHGWVIKLFVRNKDELSTSYKEDMDKLKTLLQNLSIPFQDGERLIYPTQFKYGDIESLRIELESILDKLCSAGPRGPSSPLTV